MTGVPIARTETPSRPGSPAPAARLAIPPLAIGLPAVTVFVWWTVEDGGAAPGVWYPGALLLLVAFFLVARRSGSRRLPRTTRLALAALAGFTLWSFASIAWADARGDAWDAANRALLYLTVFAIFAALPWRPGEAAGLLGAFALATAGTGVWAVAAAIAGADPGAFADGRLAGPVGYANASGALLLAAFWPALLLAARRSTPTVLRSVLLAAAGVLLELVVLAQSRGSVLAGAVGLALVLLLHHERARVLLFLTAVAVTTVASLPTLLHVYDAGRPDELHDALVAAATAMALSAAILLAAPVVADRVSGRRAAARLRAPWWRWLAGGSALAVAGALWAAAPDTRLTAGTDTGRYDFWRVAAQQFAEHPLGGAGAGNFAHDYVRERRRLEEPLYPHSLVLGSLGHMGIVGASLLTGFLVAAFAGPRRLGGPDDARRVVGLAAVVSAAVWLTQASIDWLWELPALAAPAIAFLGLVAGLGLAPAVAAPPASRRLGLAVGVATCLAAASFALPALAARDVERAVRDWDEAPGAAIARLERARDLNFLSNRPDVIAGALALRGGDGDGARQAFGRAIDRDAHDWYPRVELALLDLQDGREGPALIGLEAAQRLNPREPAIVEALEAARLGRPVPPSVRERLASLTVAGPLGRRSLECRPVLGLGADCSAEAVR